MLHVYSIIVTVKERQIQKPSIPYINIICIKNTKRTEKKHLIFSILYLYGL